MKTGRRLRVGILAACLWLLPGPVEAACTVSTTSVNVGAYDVFAAVASDSTGIVTFRCDARTTVTVQLARGSAATFAPRTLRQGADVLNYNLYLNSARTTVWGDGTGGLPS